MEKTTVDKAKTGSILARDVYTIDGKLLVKKGTIYREPLFQRFLEYGVEDIYLEAAESEQEESTQIQQDVMGPGEMEALIELQKPTVVHDVIQEKTRNHAHTQMKKTLSDLSSVSSSNLYQIKRIVEEMIEQLLAKKDFVTTLSQMRSIDDYTYKHSVNVGVLSLIIGIDMGLEGETLRHLGMGAMLHDIGKILVSEEIIKKPSKLTPREYDEVKRHTEYGYELLKQMGIPEEAAIIALCHHEKYDGTGYNRGIGRTDIPLLARIVAVADVYDAMSHDRVYQRRVSHDKVYREITHLGDIHFDSEIMELFVKRLHIYPTGIGIILNNGERGMVIGQNRLYPESPIIRVFTPHKKNIKELYYDIDLSKEKILHIVETF